MSGMKHSVRRLVDKLLRGRLIKAYGLVRPRVTDDVWETAVTYDPGTDIGALLFYSGEFEKRDVELCRSYITPDSVVLDIGANIGLHSIFFASLTPRGRVLAFEPSMATFELLTRNTRGKHNVSPLNIALSDTGGVKEFFEADDNAYSSLVDTKRTRIEAVARVVCMRADDIVRDLQLSRVDFVKIDVEGLEYNVLRGMEDVIAKHRPVLFCEIYKGVASNQQPDKTVRFLLDRGYRAYVLRDGGMVEYKEHDDNYYNYLFLPEGKATP